MGNPLKGGVLDLNAIGWAQTRRKGPFSTHTMFIRRISFFTQKIGQHLIQGIGFEVRATTSFGGA
jgi:hypothetical protein